MQKDDAWLVALVVFAVVGEIVWVSTWLETQSTYRFLGMVLWPAVAAGFLRANRRTKAARAAGPA